MGFPLYLKFVNLRPLGSLFEIQQKLHNHVLLTFNLNLNITRIQIADIAGYRVVLGGRSCEVSKTYTLHMSGDQDFRAD